MNRKDTRPVLSVSNPPPVTTRTLASPTSDTQDKLAHAMEALRAAVVAEVRQPSANPVDQIVADSFTPIGAPKPRAHWRASTPSETPGKRAGRVGAATGAVTLSKPDEKDPLVRRITAIHLPRFAIERWHRWAMSQNEAPPEDIPAALAIEGPHGPIIHATNRAAEIAGIQSGARVVDMRALCPDLKITFADINGDQKALEKLMLWMRRWCPWTALDGPAGLVLDTTGSDHLWGGETAMLRDMEERLAHIGFSANLAVSPTHGASWALARFGAVREVCEPEALNLRISTLPVRALRLSGNIVQLLNRLGLKTVGDLVAVPRISLARRFTRSVLADNPLRRLDQMMGRLVEPISASDDPPRFAVQANLAEPVQDPTPHLPALCAALCKGLAAAGFGARRLRVTVFRSDGEISTVEVATAHPNRDPAHLLKLFDDKLDSINPGFGFDLITLGATVAEALHVTQADLSQKGRDGAGLPHLIDRLTARLGTQAVRRPAPHASHAPERAEQWSAALHTGPTPLTGRTSRPIRIFDHPEEVRVLYAVPEGPPAQFVWRRLTRRVMRYAGPERIAPEWWRDKPSTRLRDYYRVEDQMSHRLWLYRNGVLGDKRGEIPRWFIHGVFA